MKQKHIDAAREARLWIGQIVIPAMTLAASTLAIPEVRQAVAEKANQMKWSIQHKFKKKRSENDDTQAKILDIRRKGTV